MTSQNPHEAGGFGVPAGPDFSDGSAGAFTPGAESSPDQPPSYGAPAPQAPPAAFGPSAATGPAPVYGQPRPQGPTSVPPPGMPYPAPGPPGLPQQQFATQGSQVPYGAPGPYVGPPLGGPPIGAFGQQPWSPNMAPPPKSSGARVGVIVTVVVVAVVIAVASIVGITLLSPPRSDPAPPPIAPVPTAQGTASGSGNFGALTLPNRIGGFTATREYGTRRWIGAPSGTPSVGWYYSGTLRGRSGRIIASLVQDSSISDLNRYSFEDPKTIGSAVCGTWLNNYTACFVPVRSGFVGVQIRDSEFNSTATTQDVVKLANSLASALR